MFKRLSNSLLSPKEVAKYHNEPIWKTIVFLIIIELFAIIPAIIGLSVSPLLSGSNEKTIKKAFSSETIPFQIVDGKLTNVDGDHEYVYINPYFQTLKVAITEDKDNFTGKINKGVANPLQITYIAFYEDGLIISNPYAGKRTYSYNDFNYLKNVDFSNKETLRSVDFWDNIFYISESIYKEVKVRYVSLSTIFDIISLTANILLFPLILAAFDKLRMGHYITFGKIYKVSLYNIAPMVICNVLSWLFGFTFIQYVGMIVTLVFNIITVNELMKNLYLTRNEGK